MPVGSMRRCFDVDVVVDEDRDEDDGYGRGTEMGALVVPFNDYYTITR